MTIIVYIILSSFLRTLFQSDPEKLCQELELCSSESRVKIIKKIFVEKLKTSPQIIAYKSSVKVSKLVDKNSCEL